MFSLEHDAKLLNCARTHKGINKKNTFSLRFFDLCQKGIYFMIFVNMWFRLSKP